jgi:uncharacterized membrane protein YedE/YeeE
VVKLIQVSAVAVAIAAILKIIGVITVSWWWFAIPVGTYVALLGTVLVALRLMANNGSFFKKD